MSGKDSAMNRVVGLSIVIAGIALGRMLKQTENTLFMLRMTPTEIDQNLANHSFLHIGGHHRGGTTIIWDALKCHPLTSALGTKSDIAMQRFPWIHKVHHEGIFLQDVYPTFSLDHPPSFFWKRSLSHFLQYWFPGLDFFELELVSFRYQNKRLQEGIGSFAMNPNSHLTETHPLASRASAERLLNQWGSLWDFSKPLLLEKSPSNARIPRFLHALWNQVCYLLSARCELPNLTRVWCQQGASAQKDAGDDEEDDELVEEEGSVRLEGPKTRFLFMTRHPIMQAMAMVWCYACSDALCRGTYGLAEIKSKMAFVDDLTLHQRVEHWLAVEESFQNDAKFLPSGSTFTLQLENLVAEPEKHLEALVKWLGFQHGMNGFDKTLLKEWLNSLQADPNKKYEEAYRTAVKDDAAVRKEHVRLVEEFGERVRAVSGYELSMGLLDEQ